MQRDHYEILGISRNATEADIKKAYRDLAKRYHPDNFNDEGMRALAEEKMKEINEAYDALTRLQKRQSYEYSGTYTSSKFVKIRELINEHNFAEADRILDAMSDSERGAEWNFLKGCLMSQRGWYLDASRFFETACRLDPQNQEYRYAYDTMRQNAEAYTRGYKQATTRSTDGSFCSDFCKAYICFECCECLCEGLCESLGNGC